MHCLISIVIRQWSAVHDEVAAHKRRLLDLAAGVDLPRPPIFSAATGCLLVVDWDGGQVLAGLTLPKPTGFLLHDGKLQVALWESDEIVTLCGAAIVARLQHRFFNHVHTLDRTPRGLLVSSSGSDLLAEIDERGELLWQYFLFQHGYGQRFRFGQSFDASRSYNGRYLPAALTTHPNSAIRLDDDSVLATLFSTGELVRIDRQSGESKVLLSGIKRPHAIRRRPRGGYMLCDTEGGAVVLLSADLQVEARLSVPAAWIQDATLTAHGSDDEGRLLVVGNRRIVASPLSAAGVDTQGDNYVLELRKGSPQMRLSLGPDSRIYMVEPIAKADAEGLAQAWRASEFDPSFARFEPACA